MEQNENQTNGRGGPAHFINLDLQLWDAISAIYSDADFLSAITVVLF